jgi:tetratricopeptide (TPR) repeat protein
MFRNRLMPVLMSLFVLACAPNRQQQLRARVPGLSKEDIRHLVSDDDSTYAAYARQVGVMRLLDVESRLTAALNTTSPQAYARSLAALGPYLDRVTDRLAVEYHLPEFREAVAYNRRLDPAGREAVTGADRRRNHLIATPDLTAAEKETGLLQVLDVYRKYDFRPGVVVTEFALARQADAQSHSKEGVEWLRRAERHARQWNLTLLECQVLGALGSWYAAQGESDSMSLCLDRALTLARRVRHPYQTSRILTFYGNAYWRRGRLAVARDYFTAAYEACRKYKADSVTELRVLNDTLLNLYARLGCWDAVGELLPRAHLLERKFLKSPRAQDRTIWVTSKSIEMRFRFARGDVAGARRIFKEIRGVARKGVRTTYAGLMESWCEGLLQNDALDPASAAAKTGLDYAVKRNLPDAEAAFALDLAQVQVRTGRYVEAGASLERYRDVRGKEENDDVGDWARYDALETLRLQGLGRSDEAAEVIARGRERLRSALAFMDPTPLAYLRLGTCGRLHDEILALHPHDPKAGYLAEMEWRGLVRSIGTARRDDGGARSGSPPASPRSVAGTGDSASGEGPGDDLLKRLAAGNVLHLVYRIQPRRVIRWTAGPEASVRADTLTVVPDSLRAWIHAARSAMESGPEGMRGAAPELERLARVLLPPAVLNGTVTARRILITPDGWLSLLPFGALDLTPGPGYAPLLGRYEIACLRYQTTAAPPARGAPLVVIDPLISPELRRRYPSLHPLATDRREVTMASNRFPRAEVLTGRQATKARILEAWGSAPLLYVASHVVRDPEAPYLTFVPVAAAGSADGDADYLSMEDVTAADLHGCVLAILAGCASGVPYVSSGGEAPSLGEVFLDAGAHAVVETFFPVRDEETATIMNRFLGAWSEAGMDPVTALTRARREALANTHDFGWAAFSVELSGI